ncbi:MAG: hypothetical protein ACFFAY_06030 [Promethearchaeota archaeon]
MKRKQSLSSGLFIVVLLLIIPLFSHGSSISAINPHRAPLPFFLSEVTWEDSCNSTDGWNQQNNASGFVTKDWVTSAGSLQSTNGYICADGLLDLDSIPSGPLFTKHLEPSIPIRNFSSFEAELEVVYEFGQKGFLSVYLFDHMKERLGMLRIHDDWLDSESRADCAYYRLGESGDGTGLASTFIFSWRVTLKICREPSNGTIIAEIDDGTPETKDLLIASQYNESREIHYIGIHAARYPSANYDGQNLRVHNIALSYFDVVPTTFIPPVDDPDDSNPNDDNPKLGGEENGFPIGFVGVLAGFLVIGFLAFARPRNREFPTDIHDLPLPNEPTPITAIDIDSKPLVPIGEKPVGESKLGKGVHTLRGCHITGFEFQYKVKVLNNTESVITNVVVSILAYPEDCMSLKGESSKTIKRIEPNGFRSPLFTFLPTQDCVEGTIQATVSYIDHRNEAHTSSTKPFVIRSVCDLLTPLNLASAVFDKIFLESTGTTHRETIELGAEELFSKANQILPLKNFHIVESESTLFEGQFMGTIKGAAEGKYTGRRIEIRVGISGDVSAMESQVTLEVSGDDDAMLPGTLKEISEGLNSWICMHCAAPMNPGEVVSLRAGNVVQCNYCSRSMTLNPL